MSNSNVEENAANTDVRDAVEKTPDEKFDEAVINDVIDKVPEEDRHEVRKMMSLSMQMGRVMSNSPELELMKKMTPAHITMYLEGQKEAVKFQFMEEREKKIFLGLMLLISLIAILVLVYMLKQSPDVLEKVLYALVGLAAGAFGGYGVGRNRRE